MTKRIVKTSNLSKQELRNIRNLWETCASHDKYNIKLYWNILANRQLPEFDDILYYQDNTLIGYLALFLFKEDQAELNALVHPQYRRKGMFTHLLAEAKIELKQRRINDTLLICNKENKFAEKWIQALPHVQFDHAECQMHHVTKPMTFPELPSIEFQVATENDIPLLARLDNACFNSSYDQVIFRFSMNMREKVRTAYIATHNNQVIGKCHIRIDDGDKVFIHDVCVPPEHQRKHYATSMVLQLLEMYKRQGFKIIYLDVLADNEKAIKLYERCGFKITAHHDFYRIPVTSL